MTLTLKLKDSQLFGIVDGEELEIVNPEDFGWFENGAFYFFTSGSIKIDHGDELLWTGTYESLGRPLIQPCVDAKECLDLKEGKEICKQSTKPCPRVHRGAIQIRLIPAKKEEKKPCHCFDPKECMQFGCQFPRDQTVNNSQREEKTIEADLVSLMESLKESGFVTFINKSGDIISVKGILTDIITRLKVVNKEETQEERYQNLRQEWMKDKGRVWEMEEKVLRWITEKFKITRI
jgi:hypothetical protein